MTWILTRNEKSAVLKRDGYRRITWPFRQLSRIEGISEAQLHKCGLEARSQGQASCPLADAWPEGGRHATVPRRVLETDAVNEGLIWPNTVAQGGLFPVQSPVVANRRANRRTNWGTREQARLGQATKKEKKADKSKDLNGGLLARPRISAKPQRFWFSEKSVKRVWRGRRGTA